MDSPGRTTIFGGPLTACHRHAHLITSGGSHFPTVVQTTSEMHGDSVVLISPVILIGTGGAHISPTQQWPKVTRSFSLHLTVGSGDETTINMDMNK